MSGILDILNSELGKTIINGVSRQTGQNENKTRDVITMAMPVLMEAMKRNASSPKGADGLLSALNNKHDGSILDNLKGMLGGNVSDNVLEDGDKILGHVLGSKQQRVETILSQKSGVDANSIAKTLKIAAPILMGVLGRQTRQQNVNSSSGLENLLGGLISGNSQQQEQSFLESILDADGDGSVIDDVAGMVLGSNKKKGGLGGLLGSLFGKK